MKNFLFRVPLAILIVGSAVGAQATGDYLDVFLKNYKLAETSALGTKSCSVCHVSDEDFSLNSYGKEVHKAMAGAGTLTAAHLATAEAADSDGDGNANGVEIKADTFPADPKSGGRPGAAVAEQPKEDKPWFPKTAYHPAIVHFPIGLFIAGLFLDFLGLIRKDKTLLHAGWYNLILAALSAVGGLASGYIAMTLMKFPLRGAVLNHLIWAVVASALMWVMVALRVHQHEKIKPAARVIYYVLAAACLLILSWAGHIGGEIAGTA